MLVGPPSSSVQLAVFTATRSVICFRDKTGSGCSFFFLQTYVITTDRNGYYQCYGSSSRRTGSGSSSGSCHDHLITTDRKWLLLQSRSTEPLDLASICFRDKRACSRRCPGCCPTLDADSPTQMILYASPSSRLVTTMISRRVPTVSLDQEYHSVLLDSKSSNNSLSSSSLSLSYRTEK